MSPITVRTLDDVEISLTDADLSALSTELDGEVFTPGDPGYDEDRTIWNAMIDRRPALSVRCRSANDVALAMRFAAENDLLVCIRGAGHNIAGNAVCDGALMISLADMRNVTVDPTSRSARVEAGATLADFDRAAQEHGLATPVGINSTTGIAGLTLGGGFGWLSREHGMTVDNLTGAEVVLPSGERVRASRNEHPDLFWAIRGGGGNFGIVTSFEFQLHPVGPEVLSGLVVHPLEEAKSVLGFYREYVDTLPDETAVWAVLRKAPPLPFLPEEWHGREVVILAAFHGGDMEEGGRILQPLRDFGDPIADVIGPHLTPGARNYWKSHDFSEISESLIDVLVDYAGRLPSPQCEIFIAQLGGAAGRVPDDAMAYPHRDTKFVMNVHTRWDEPSEDNYCVSWAREFFEAAAPHATGTVYVNFMPEDEGDRVRMAYGSNFDRLRELKTEFDPRNRLRLNQNIQPRVQA